MSAHTPQRWPPLSQPHAPSAHPHLLPPVGFRYAWQSRVYAKWKLVASPGSRRPSTTRLTSDTSALARRPPPTRSPAAREGGWDRGEWLTKLCEKQVGAVDAATRPMQQLRVAHAKSSNRLASLLLLVLNQPGVLGAAERAAVAGSVPCKACRAEAGLDEGYLGNLRTGRRMAMSMAVAQRRVTHAEREYLLRQRGSPALCAPGWSLVHLPCLAQPP